MAETVEDDGGGQPFGFFVGGGRTKVAIEELLFGGHLLEFTIVFGHNPFVCPVEPIPFSAIQFVHGLRIKLSVVYRTGGVYHSCHFDADETAAARRVGEQVLLIARGDERGITAHFEHGVGIRLAHGHHRFLEDVLQEALLRGAHLVEFIDVYQRKTIQIQLGVALVREVDAVRVVSAQFRWDDVAAKGRFTSALNRCSG